MTFFKRYQQELAIATGLVFFLSLYLINPFHLEQQARIVLASGALMVSWWVLEAMPLPVVALVPIVLFPLLHISPIKEVTRSYADSMIFLFMGGFFLALAIEKWDLHKRIALSIIRYTGTNGNKIILGFIISTGFLSMWLSNTATTMMMYPIAVSVIQVIGQQEGNEKGMKNFSLVLMLSIAYASNFALGTIIGTPPNVAYASYILEKFGYSIGFTNWMIVFTPLTVLLLLMQYWVLVKWMYPNGIRHSETGKKYIDTELKKLGPLSKPEKRVLFIFILTVLLWITKDLLNAVQKIIQLDDTIIAMTGATLLFIFPSGRSDKAPSERLLEWPDTSKMAWGILLLFGGGIALANALEAATLMDQLGQWMASFSTNNTLLMVLIVTTVSVFLSEVMSNVAQVIVMAPVISSLATALHMQPLMLGIAMTLGASCASMLPMGTPPNAIVFASGHIKLKDMLKTGFVMNIICIVLVSLFCYFILPMVMKL